MSDCRLCLVASPSEGAVENLLAPILWSEGAQEHAVFARDVSNHKKATKCGGRAHKRYCMKLTIFITLSN